MAEEKILLSGQEFTAVEIVDLTQSAVVPEHKVEDGYPVADHIFFQPAEFQLTLTLLENEIEALKQLYEAKEPTELVCKAGVFEDVVIRELTITQGGSKNTFRAVVRVKQILKAKAKTAEIPLQQLQVTPNENDDKETKGGNTAITPQTKQVPQAPKQPQGSQSWLDSVVSFLGGIFGFGGG
ncbi:phage baseplate protein [Archaeoglobus profundus]|uniref:Dit-like phage tail protein N-terminal domain-containing protein n=1 Tax=Archaeoglobus profundus (strain DSM 5631 / JCM 9629 / NBRC 100127 / Av18) TaxID=572546 RepID=D2REI8_ARCPA|nr:hypothetical protein [Archaeoglobus profundus]ADB58532.1 hypothetical protein Arcpr_1485 [Archaeoglobus profundus DSM 5631]